MRNVSGNFALGVGVQGCGTLSGAGATPLPRDAAGHRGDETHERSGIPQGIARDGVFQCADQPGSQKGNHTHTNRDA
jgi:hypothetical protein